MEQLKRWLAEEPVRVWLYGVLEPLAGLLVVYGVVSSAALPVVLGVLAAVMAVPVTQKVRSQVIPMTKLDSAVTQTINDHTYNHTYNDTYTP